MKSLRLASLLLFGLMSLAIASVAVCAPQRMGLVAGSFRVGGANDVTRSGVTVPAYCLDLDRNVASDGYNFSILDPQSSKSYVELDDGRRISLVDGIKTGIVRMEGTGKMLVRFSAGPAAAGHSFDVHIELGEQAGTSEDPARNRQIIKSVLDGKQGWYDSVQRVLWSKFDLPNLQIDGSDAVAAFKANWPGLPDQTAIPDTHTQRLVAALRQLNELKESSAASSGAVPASSTLIFMPPGKADALFFVGKVTSNGKNEVQFFSKASDAAEYVKNSNPTLIAVSGYGDKGTQNITYSLRKHLSNKAVDTGGILIVNLGSTSSLGESKSPPPQLERVDEGAAKATLVTTPIGDYKFRSRVTLRSGLHNFFVEIFATTAELAERIARAVHLIMTEWLAGGTYNIGALYKKLAKVAVDNKGKALLHWDSESKVVSDLNATPKTRSNLLARISPLATAAMSQP